MRKSQRGASRAVLIGVIVVVAVATALVTALLVNIFERKSEARSPYVRLVEVTEDTTDPAQVGRQLAQAVRRRTCLRPKPRARASAGTAAARRCRRKRSRATRG